MPPPAACMRLALDIHIDQGGESWQRQGMAKPVIVVSEGSPGSIHPDLRDTDSAGAADSQQLILVRGASDLGEGRHVARQAATDRQDRRAGPH